MIFIRGALHLLHVLSLFYITDSQNCAGSQQKPSLGDVMIRSDGAVTIYYSDGTIEPVWVPICTDRAGNSIFTVICRQLGYQTHRIIQEAELKLRIRHQHASDNHFLHISCDDEPTDLHILRCEHSFSSNCPNSIIIHNHSFICENPLISSPYEGQVYLCPPNNFPVGSCTVSTGLVRVYLHKTWRGINQRDTNYRLGTHEADSICRQLGYTSAVENSAVVVQATEQDFSHCYSSGITIHALVTTNQLNCESSQECIGCCFKSYPQQFCNECENSSDIVITCNFDPTLSLIEGSSNLCTFKDETLGSTCGSNGQGLSGITIGLVGTASALGGVILITIAISIACHCFYRRLYRRYQRLQQDAGHGNPNHQAQHLQEDAGHGNPNHQAQHLQEDAGRGNPNHQVQHIQDAVRGNPNQVDNDRAALQMDVLPRNVRDHEAARGINGIHNEPVVDNNNNDNNIHQIMMVGQLPGARDDPEHDEHP